MKIDAEFYRRTISRRLFIVFRELSKEVRDGRVSEQEYVGLWVNLIEKISHYEEINKEFWELIRLRTRECGSDFKSTFERFYQLKTVK